LGAGCTLVASSLGARLLPGITSLPERWQQLGALGWTSLVLTIAVALWLVGVAIASGTRITLARRSHRRGLDVVAGTLESEAGHLVGVQLVEYPAAVAYCLPGLRSRIVVSRGAVDALPSSQLRAVLAHERAHARSRHDLVVQPFIAWRATFPFLPTATTALRAVELLVEMLADDRARRSCAPSHLREALRQLAGEYSALAPSPGQLTTQVAVRTARLTTPPPSLPLPIRLVVYLTAMALLVGPPIALLLG
jgi:Zn-dependent protease with chaperone function